MPERAQHYYGMQDLYYAMQEVEAELHEKRDRDRAKSFYVQVQRHIKLQEQRIDFARDHNIDTPSRVFHRLEELRAYRARIEKLLCLETTASSPIPPASKARNAGKSALPKAGKASSSASRARSARNSGSAGLMK